MDLLPHDDLRWASYQSGYRRPFDCRPLLQHPSDHGFSDWFADLTWDELHHQGDVGDASYAVLPHLVSHAATLDHVDVELLVYASVLEVCRQNPDGQKKSQCPFGVAKWFRESDCGLALHDARHDGAGLVAE